MYTALQIAQYIISKSTLDDNPISNLQLQKVLFYLQKSALQKTKGTPLFEEDFVAWQFGPVIEEVYYYFCSFGAMPIRRVYSVRIDELTKRKINPIIEEKRRLNPWDMVSETHKRNGAWYHIYHKIGNGGKISKELILDKG